MNVIKRDGRIEAYDFSKIKNAIIKCYKSLNKDYPEEVFTKISNYFSSVRENTPIEHIQNYIVDVLKEVDQDAANAYQDYRNERTRIRDLQTNGHYYDTIMELVRGEENATSKENANKNAKQLFTMRDLIAGETCKKLYRELIMSTKLKELHDKGIVHVHDCDYRLMQGITNCTVFNLKDMLENGTVMNGKLIESPKTLRTAATVATQIITAIGNSEYGGISMSMSHLAPYVRKSKNYWNNYLDKFWIFKWGWLKKKTVDLLLKKEINDAIQTFNYQLNSMSCSSGQSPFITVFCRVDEDPEYTQENALLIAELFRQRIKGMKSPNGLNINPTFPKIVYVLDENNIHEDSEFYYLTKLAAKCTCKRMVPDYLSAKKAREYKEGRVISPMGCRSFLHPWKNSKGEYQEYGRLNLGVMSINLPYLALQANKNKEDFEKRIRDMIDFISGEQYKVYKSIANTKVDVAPILWQYGAFSRAESGTLIGDIIKDRYASISIGYMGIAECVQFFDIPFVSDEGKEFGLWIMKVINDQIDKNKEKYNIALSLYGTPSESLTTKFAGAIKRDFPNALSEGIYHLTNSYHVPVQQKIDGYKKIEFESDFQKYSLGGCISYIEMPDIHNNPESVMNVLKHIYDHMMYCELNTTSCDVCYKCGYEGQIDLDLDGNLKCPNCGNTDKDTIYAIRRMCGYLGSISNGVSKGRASDIINRVKHF